MDMMQDYISIMKVRQLYPRPESVLTTFTGDKRPKRTVSLTDLSVDAINAIMMQHGFEKKEQEKKTEL